LHTDARPENLGPAAVTKLTRLAPGSARQHRAQVPGICECYPEAGWSGLPRQRRVGRWRR